MRWQALKRFIQKVIQDAYGMPKYSKSHRVEVVCWNERG